MAELFTVAQIQSAERPLLDGQTEPDELMRQAAAAVARVASTLLPPAPASPPRMLLLVGPGGNGGDALYAGAALRREVSPAPCVMALLTAPTVHERARNAFLAAGGTLVNSLADAGDPGGLALVVDGMMGLGGRPGLRHGADELASRLADALTLAVDLPSGVAADSGEDGASHVRADHTVTFGGLRHAHAFSSACGEVHLADIALPSRPELPSLAQILHDQGGTAYHHVLNDPLPVPYLEPGAHDDKYTGGVVGIAAGSTTYPGAGILATLGALRATPAMVRAVGIPGVPPEVVGSATVEDTGRVQAWVVGPGRGTGKEAASELKDLLARPEPLLCDADALTLLAGSVELRGRLRNRVAPTVLTPHSGEFARLRGAMGENATGDAIADARALARELRCTVLLKGRVTVIATASAAPGAALSATRTAAVNAGHSWSATPGSGDVLAGVIGAWLAREAAQPTPDYHRAVVHACEVHAMAAYLSALTPDGPGPTSASLIAASVPRASARLATAARRAH